MLRAIGIITLTISSLLPTGIQNSRPNRRPDFTISCNPLENKTSAGSDSTFSITVHPIGAWINALQLSVDGLHKLARAEFSPNPISVANYTSTLTVSTGPAVISGTYTLRITGQVITRNPTASSFRTTHCKLRITKVRRKPPDFNIIVSPASVTVNQGHSASYHVTIIPSKGFNEAIGIELSAPVPGMSIGPGTIPEYRPPYHLGAFVLTIDPAVPSGTYKFGIWATARSVRRVANAQVTIRRQ